MVARPHIWFIEQNLREGYTATKDETLAMIEYIYYLERHLNL